MWRGLYLATYQPSSVYTANNWCIPQTLGRMRTTMPYSVRTLCIGHACESMGWKYVEPTYHHVLLYDHYVLLQKKKKDVSRAPLEYSTVHRNHWKNNYCQGGLFFIYFMFHVRYVWNSFPTAGHHNDWRLNTMFNNNNKNGLKFSCQQYCMRIPESMMILNSQPC